MQELILAINTVLQFAGNEIISLRQQLLEAQGQQAASAETLAATQAQLDQVQTAFNEFQTVEAVEESQEIEQLQAMLARWQQMFPPTA
ncbi:MAG: hypothetical protein ACRC62_04675 [Microcoleus sp.]